MSAVRKWAVLVDGSSVSAKAFDAACLFLTSQVLSIQPSLTYTGTEDDVATIDVSEHSHYFFQLKI